MQEVAALIVTRMKKKKRSISNGDIINTSKKIVCSLLEVLYHGLCSINGTKMQFYPKTNKNLFCSVSEFGCADPVGAVSDHFAGCILCSDTACGLDPDVRADVILHKNDVFDLGACTAETC